MPYYPNNFGIPSSQWRRKEKLKTILPWHVGCREVYQVRLHLGGFWWGHQELHTHHRHNDSREVHQEFLAGLQDGPESMDRKKEIDRETEKGPGGYLRDKFHFSEVHGSMNATGHVESKRRPKGITSTLHRTRCVHTSMNLRKMKFISYIYTLFLHCFCSLFVEIWCKSCK